MEEILRSFTQDLQDIEKVVELLEGLSIFGQEPVIDEALANTAYLRTSAILHKKITDGHPGSVKIPGTLMLYLGGRFEHFVKILFEDLSSQVANNYTEFKKLPTTMQQALIFNTSEVIASPRKFGHGDGARDTFIKNLADNIHLNNLSHINYQCLSITSTNMRPDIIAELFAKVGLKDIWKKIGEQAKIKTYFGTDANQYAETECRKYLDNFMETRNKIAHPSGSFTWPSNEELKNHIKFFKLAGIILLEICEMYLAKLATDNLRLAQIEEQSSNTHLT